MTVFIYTLSDPDSLQIRYVGKSTNKKRRLKEHMRENCGRKTNWIKSLKARGAEPILEDLEVFENSDDQDWRQAEVFWISYLRFLGFDLCNIEVGGMGGLAGRVVPPEVRAKIGAGNRKKHTPEQIAARTGWKHSPESIEKIRASKLGKEISPKLRAALIMAGLRSRGIKRTPLLRKKLSEAQYRRWANHRATFPHTPIPDQTQSTDSDSEVKHCITRRNDSALHFIKGQ